MANTELKTFLDEEGLNAYHSGNMQKITEEIEAHNSSFTSHEDMRSDISDINETVLDLQSDSHKHSNKTILDNTTESFTTVLKNKLDGIDEGANLYILPNATAANLGGVTIGNNVQVTNGKISVLDGSTSQTGVVALEDSISSNSTSTAATPSSVKKAYDLANTANNAVGEHNIANDSHSDIRISITDLITRLNALANSDDTTLDQLKEIVDYIKSNRTLIEEITTNKVNVADIINNLTSNITNKPLSATQGVVLKGLIDTLQEEVDSKQLIITGAATTITDSNLTANRVLMSSNTGKVTVSNVTNTELGYLSGVSSNIQEQIDNRTAVEIVRWS